MTWYRFDWDVFVTDDMIGRVAGAVGHPDPGAVRALIGPRLRRVLEVVGGPPVGRGQPDADERTELAAGLLHQAVGHALAPYRDRTAPGFVLENRDGAAPLLHAFDRIDVNRASAAELESLPAVGDGLARAIVAERTAAGAFRNLDDLVERVHGLGPVAARQLQATTELGAPTARPPLQLPGTLEGDLALLVTLQQRPDAAAGLDAAFDVLVGQLSGQRRRRRPGEWESTPGAAPAASVADEVVVLFGSSYFSELQRIFGAATSRIDVCMFHVVLPQPGHPTAQLLHALIDAHSRGVAVRVLLDSDRPTDPYLSTVINTPAATHLAAHGVAVRMDPAHTLLHSKFVLVDDQLTLVGSHNWSAGSYFHFDDLTLAVRSTLTCAAMRGRFDQLWGAGSDL